jgi:hypothetical protein
MVPMQVSGARDGARDPYDRHPLWRLVALLVIAIAVSFAVLPESALAQTSAPPPVDLLGGTAPRTISLRLVPVQPPTSTAIGSTVEYMGELHLPLRNLTDNGQEVRVIYAPDESQKVREIASVALRPRSVMMLNLSFPLQPDRPPSVLDGTLDFQTFPQTGSGGGGPCSSPRRPHQSCPIDAFTLRVIGEIQPLADLRFEPASVVVQVTRACLFSCNTTSGGAVRLYGAGVDQLLEWMLASGRSAISTELRSGSDRLGVTLQHLRADKTHPGQAIATITLAQKPGPGKYAGTLPLSQIAPSSPALPLEVRSRIWVVWTVIVIFLGVLCAGLLYVQVGLRRRKQLLTRALTDVIDSYCARASENSAPLANERLIWSLDVECPLKENPNWTYYDELDSADNIYTAVRWARNDADLDEAQSATLTLILGIKTWLLALTEVGGLRELARRPRPRPAEWNSTRVALDSELLLRRAQRTPVDAAAASQLLEQVETQTSWHRRCAEAWDLRQQLIDAGGLARDKARSVALKRLIDEAEPITSRTRDQQDQLDVILDRLYDRLLALQRQAGGERPRPRTMLRLTAPDDREREAAVLRVERHALLHAASPQLGLAAAAAGTALLGGRPKRAVEDQGLALVASSPPSARSAAQWSRVQFLRALRLSDIAVSGVVLLISAVLYTVTVYGDTWGSPTDWVSAFGFGFGGQAVVRWALLPVYRSIRLRASAGAATDVPSSA